MDSRASANLVAPGRRPGPPLAPVASVRSACYFKGDMPGRFDEDQGLVQVRPETKKKLAKPRLWKVLLHNDDYTTQDFVVEILERVFRKSHDEAVTIMLHVHRKGVGVAGVYPYDVAETKVETVRTLARQREFPLLCTMEPE